MIEAFCAQIAAAHPPLSARIEFLRAAYVDAKNRQENTPTQLAHKYLLGIALAKAQIELAKKTHQPVSSACRQNEEAGTSQLKRLLSERIIEAPSAMPASGEFRRIGARGKNGTRKVDGDIDVP